MKNWKKLQELIIAQYDEFVDYMRDAVKENYEFRHQVDIYAYINDDETAVTFDQFTNVGGNSWLADDHFTIYSFKPSYHTFIEDFDSPKEFVDYMIDCYNVAVPFDDYADEDGKIDYQDCAAYISENCGEVYEKAKNDLIDETWGETWGWIIDSIFDSIKDKVQE